MIDYFNIGVYRSSVIVIIDEQSKNIRRWIKRNCKDIPEEDINGICESNDNDIKGKRASALTYKSGCNAIIILSRNEVYDVSHECFHAAHHILNHCGVELTADGEAYAYMVGYISNKVFGIVGRYFDE